MKIKSFALYFKVIIALTLLISSTLAPIVFAQEKTRDLKKKTETAKPKPSEKATNQTVANVSHCSPSVSQNTNRVALVIGNQDYELSPLINPINDANLIAEALRDVGFDVILRENLNNQEFDEAVKEFGSRLVPGGVALFYYAGHGVQFADRNYLVPVDFTNIENLSGENVENELFYIGKVLDAVIAENNLNILIFDACRNAPVDLQLPAGTKPGFASINTTTYAGTYIAYSTSPGNVATDGKGFSNSPYSYWLADSIKLSPSRIEDVFKRTRIQVERMSGGKQITWESSSLKKDFYFVAENLSALPKDRNFFNISLNVPASMFRTENFELRLFNESGSLTNRKTGAVKFFVENLRPLPPGVKNLEMAQIKGGTFLMGTSGTDALTAFQDLRKNGDEAVDWAINEMPQHCVGVAGFYISRYEITQAQWLFVMGNLPAGIPSEFLGINKPVVNVSWEDAVLFCEKLSKMTGKIYRLPTEAEWEFAARAESKTPFGFGMTLIPAIANYYWLSSFGAGPGGREPLRRVWNVGESLIANANGLFDMHGNVAEWCEDIYYNDYKDAPKNGSARQPNEDSENARVIRGGSWEDIPAHCRSTSRWKAAFNQRTTNIGFRVVTK